MKKWGKTLWFKLGLAALCLVAAAGVLLFLYRSQNPTLLAMKQYVKYQIVRLNPMREHQETEGIEPYSEILMVDQEGVDPDRMDYRKDNKRMYFYEGGSRLVNYTDGYQIDLPSEVTVHFSLSPLFVVAESPEYSVTISRETSPYLGLDADTTQKLANVMPDVECKDGVEQYIAYYFNRFILSESWQQANRIQVEGPMDIAAGDTTGEVIYAVMEDAPEGERDGYAYVTIRTGLRDIFRLMYRYDSSNEEFKDQLARSLQYFRDFPTMGTAKYLTDFEPVLPQEWSEETRELYDKIANADEIRWGIFAEDIYGKGIEETVPRIEEEIGYHFPVVLSYFHFNEEFPVEFMQENYEQGRIVELTFQLTESNNENLMGYTPNIDLYRGLKDDKIREIARAAKEFGHPFLFRINNEMNSDWTSYSGVVNMSDPELFKANWRRIYRIFQEEGVDNCIWIFNPNDRNAPPCRWNDGLAYYPGNEYVQLLGVTGYNNGTYYTEWGEQWREFEQIYDHVQWQYEPFFSDFPWIITEFASSSVGGDKVKWIENMFEHLDKYPNIKIAVWFSYADYDGDPAFGAPVARPYWLDETPETLAAFAEGVKENGIEGWD